MKIQIIAGPHAGEVQSVTADPYYSIMEKLGFIEILPDPVPQKPQTKLTWTLCRTTGAGAQLHVVAACSCGNRIAIFNPSKRASFVCCGRQEFIPADLYAKGRDEWNKDAQDRA